MSNLDVTKLRRARSNYLVRQLDGKRRGSLRWNKIGVGTRASAAWLWAIQIATETGHWDFRFVPSWLSLFAAVGQTWKWTWSLILMSSNTTGARQQHQNKYWRCNPLSHGYFRIYWLAFKCVKELLFGWTVPSDFLCHWCQFHTIEFFDWQRAEQANAVS